MLRRGYAVKQLAGFLRRQDDGQSELGGGADELQLVRPLALEGFFPEEFDGAEGLGDRGAVEFLVLLEMDEVEAKLVGGDAVGRFVEVLGQLANAGQVGLLAAWEQRQQDQVLLEGD